jgi:hypothetical protein
VGTKGMITPEMRAKAAEARKSQIRTPVSEILRQHYADEGHWLDLARARNLFMPPFATPCTLRGMRRWMRKLGLNIEWFRMWTGFGQLEEWITSNPTYSLRAWAGLLLEECETLECEKAKV